MFGVDKAGKSLERARGVCQIAKTRKTPGNGLVQ